MTTTKPQLAKVSKEEIESAAIQIHHYLNKYVIQNSFNSIQLEIDKKTMSELMVEVTTGVKYEGYIGLFSIQLRGVINKSIEELIESIEESISLLNEKILEAERENYYLD